MSPLSLSGPDELWRDPHVRAIGDLAVHVGPLYLVGGYLRDRLLGGGSATHIDFDLVTWGEPEPFARAIAKAFDGTIVLLDTPTIRVLARRAGAHIRIDINRPKGETIEADLAARDFTVNALAMRIDRDIPSTMRDIIDPSGGLEDLRQRCLRAISASAFDRDPVRLIRAVRLASQLDFRIDEATRLAIKSRAPLLAAAAGERLRDELFKIVAQVPAAPAIESLDALGLLRVLVPEVEALKSVPASPPHRLPLWEHSLETLRSIDLLFARLGRVFPDHSGWLKELVDREIEGGVTEAAILKLTGLLHDLGKPETRTVDKDGRVRFLGHEKAGIPILTRLCRRIRLGRRATALVTRIERHHLRPLHLSREDAVTPRAKYRLFRDLGQFAPAVILHSWADLRATLGEGDREFDRYQTFSRELLRFYRGEFLASKILPLVRGTDLIAVFSLPPGPFVGLVLDRLREAQAARCIQSRDEGLAYVRAHLESWRQAFQELPSSRRSDREID